MTIKKWPPEIVFKPAKISDEAGYLPIGRYWLQSQSIACHATFDADFYFERAVTFSHGLRRQLLFESEPGGTCARFDE